MITIAPKTDTPEKVERLTVGTREAAAMLGVTERTLWTWARKKKIPAVKIDRLYLFSVETLRRLVNGNMPNDND